MKKCVAFLLPIFLASSFLITSKNNNNEVLATQDRPTYNIPLLEGEELDYSNQIFDDFDNGIDSTNWWINYRSWANVNGRKNGGVVSENVFYNSDEGTAILRSTGDYYAEKSIRTPKNALAEDGKRSGGDLVSKFFTYPGRYEIRMKVSPRYGVCTTMWTYIEYGDYISSLDGRHNHEIDIELPYDGNFKKISFGNYIGGFEDTMHTSEKVLIDNPLNDGEYHTFGFDWYYNENTNHKVINYYIDGQILSTINEYVPFYKTKVNIGVWIPDSRLAGTPPRFDKAYCDIDYFKYIPFKNNHHEDATCPDGKNPYEFKTGAPLSEYPTESTPNIIRNYFPNGSFDYVNKQSSSNWTNSEVVGIENNGINVAKTTYDRNSSSTSGGASISQNGYLAGYIDSCFKGQSYNLSIDYKNEGKVFVKSYDGSDNLLSTNEYNLSNSSSWTTFSENITLDDSSVSYISVSISNENDAALIVDNIILTLGEVSSAEETSSPNDHFMAIFHENPAVLSAFSTTSGTTSSKLTNVNLNVLDYTSSINWNINVGKYEVKSGDFVYSITSSAHNNSISTATSGDYKDIYDALSAKVSLTGEQTVLYSKNAILNIKNISLSWGSCESGNVYILYKKAGSSWEYLKYYSGTSASQGTNDKQSWNRRQFILNSSDSTFSNKLLGLDAQIAFVYSSQTSNTDQMYIRYNSIIINKVQAMKAKIDYWSENSTNLCGASGKFNNTKSQEYFDLDMFNYSLTSAEANELNTSIVSVGLARELTYYDEFVYLCGVANIVPLVTLSSSRILSIFGQQNSKIVLATVVIAIIIFSSLLIFVVRRTKKSI